MHRQRAMYMDCIVLIRSFIHEELGKYSASVFVQHASNN